MKLAEYTSRIVPRTIKIEANLSDKDVDRAIEILDDMDLAYELNSFLREFVKNWHWEEDGDFMKKYFRIEVEN